MGVVQQPVKDGVGECFITDGGMPFLHRYLTGDQRGAACVAVLHKFQYIVALPEGERFQSPVIEYE